MSKRTIKNTSYRSGIQLGKSGSGRSRRFTTEVRQLSAILTDLDAQGIIIVYDVTNRRSFESLETWLSDVRERADKNVVVCIAGNKMDMKYD